MHVRDARECGAASWTCGWLCTTPAPAAVVVIGDEVRGRDRVEPSHRIAQPDRPSTISMAATISSSPSPTAGVIVSLSPMMMAPTIVRVVMWPAPQSTPISAPSAKRRSRVTMVATATRWSGSRRVLEAEEKAEQIAESGAGSTSAVTPTS